MPENLNPIDASSWMLFSPATASTIVYVLAAAALLAIIANLVSCRNKKMAWLSLALQLPLLICAAGVLYNNLGYMLVLLLLPFEDTPQFLTAYMNGIKNLLFPVFAGFGIGLSGLFCSIWLLNLPSKKKDNLTQIRKKQFS